jgi:maltose/moltooligosaccharide transporter
MLLRLFFHGQPIWALAMGGASLMIAGLCTLRVSEPALELSAATASIGRH